ncbi:MAG: MoxR family ATPase [Elusimicrobia bacterium]|nr:MoxR family ATPase [Elusimicrobiota bacterium]
MGEKTAAQDEVKAAEGLLRAKESVLRGIRRVIIGQDHVIEELLIALFSRGHCLLEGVPGLAKTLMISSLARLLDLKFSRIQFTPDLMPSDVTGTEVLHEDPQTRQRSFRFLPGPVFANMILADEINRTPPKTQSAVLEAMQEWQVTSAGATRPLPLPFFVMATQNPIEQEGTYPLPEAQLDRFFLQIAVDYPSAEDEKRIVTETTGSKDVKLTPALTGAEVLAFQDLVRRVPAPDSAVDYAVRLARMTRPDSDGAREDVRKWVAWGAGPRASQALVVGAKARALLSGRFAVCVDDVKAVAKPVLRHRLVLNFQAEAEGVRPDALIERLLQDK